jgi:hypothetical protein
MKWFLLSAIIAVAAIPDGVAGQVSPCLTNADTASWHVAAVSRTITSGDSARLVQQGLPYRPHQGVVLVTDSLICQSAINAYNALDSTSSTNISRAYVMRVGTTVYALAEPGVYYFLDSAYHFLASIVAMD